MQLSRMVDSASYGIKANASSYPITGLDMPCGLQEFEAPGISKQLTHEGGNVVTLRTDSLYPSEDIPGTHLCYRLSRLHGHSAARRIKSITP